MINEIFALSINLYVDTTALLLSAISYPVFGFISNSTTINKNYKY